VLPKRDPISLESPAHAARAPRTFRALRHRNFRLFWWGQLISVSGSWMQIAAQGWLVYRLTDSAFYLGLVGFARYFPVLLFSLIGGVIADRFPKRDLVLLTQFFAMAQAFMLAVLTSTGTVEVWQIITLAALLGVVNAFDTPARQSFIVEMVGQEDLMNAIALNSTVFNSSRIVGPMIAGVLVPTVGEASCFYLNSLSYLAVLIGLLRMDVQGLAQAPLETAKSTVWLKLHEGLRYIRSDATILTLLLLISVSSVFGISYSTLMPALARDVLGLGATGYGTMLAAVGVGALSGALFLASWGSYFPKGRLFTMGNLLFPLSLLAFSFSRSLVLSGLLLVLVGFGFILQNAMANTLLQATAKEGFRGRVMSMHAFAFIGFTPLGDLQAGTIAHFIPVPLVIRLGALVCLGAALWVLWRRPQLRSLS
jgi:MFS family permease